MELARRTQCCVAAPFKLQLRFVQAKVLAAAVELL